MKTFEVWLKGKKIEEFKHNGYSEEQMKRNLVAHGYDSNIKVKMID